MVYAADSKSQQGLESPSLSSGTAGLEVSKRQLGWALASGGAHRPGGTLTDTGTTTAQAQRCDCNQQADAAASIAPSANVARTSGLFFARTSPVDVAAGVGVASCIGNDAVAGAFGTGCVDGSLRSILGGGVQHVRRAVHHRSRSVDRRGSGVILRSRRVHRWRWRRIHRRRGWRIHWHSGVDRRHPRRVRRQAGVWGEIRRHVGRRRGVRRRGRTAEPSPVQPVSGQRGSAGVPDVAGQHAAGAHGDRRIV
jgi:hypothetical protein